MLEFTFHSFRQNYIESYIYFFSFPLPATHNQLRRSILIYFVVSSFHFLQTKQQKQFKVFFLNFFFIKGVLFVGIICDFSVLAPYRKLNFTTQFIADDLAVNCWSYSLHIFKRSDKNYIHYIFLIIFEVGFFKK